MNELHHCPFCRNANVQIHQGAQGITFLLCGDDVGRGGCGAVVSFRPNLTGSAAIAAYNRRAPRLQDFPPVQEIDEPETQF